ncbi:S8 family serine peptidase [Streptomyces hainanensis]|uniref:Peptidase S8/S53 domain-containing protein n=1 Tax=Streptomyces hainanensis TaxID=402648 RepID=A0A4R4TFD0_9ACTN|nr:S8 family serine peptidase [Streptomyces hainanensis]TDC73049.1 hypothetical protein E1283_20145 [Streptomyces hainanensis]
MPRPAQPSLRRTALISGLAAILGTLVAPGAAPAAAAAPSPAASAMSGDTVLLPTGDLVVLGPPVDGEPSVTVTPAAPSAAFAFQTLRHDGDVYVLPGDVAPLVPDVLDLELFNVTRRAAEAGAAAADSVPLIVRGPRPLAALAGDPDTVPLASIDASAVTLDADAAPTFVESLLDPPRGLAGEQRPKVWLDQRLTAAELDQNLRQIGAPEVWESGLDGSGVEVAVLDTGVDGAHPDLAGQLVAEADFTGGSPAEGPAPDENGHGTHVASVLAGTGAAADGARQGVAPGARLLSGRVLDGEGAGYASWVIAGMEWAAERGADIVNLSLGGRASGVDPVSAAVDALSAEYGTLFVVAAGNVGPTIGSIGTPGIAESALTVGAARADGGAYHGSSRGPTAGTYRAKPDVLAPGVSIVGARAGGGEGQDPYVAMTGTSQAAPHVAGAAALLWQRHPDWEWQQVKTALTTTADPYDAHQVWSHAEGGGLLDLPQATTETLVADRSALDFGYLRDGTALEGLSIPLTLTNAGTEPESLTLSDWQQAVVDTSDAPADLVRVSPAELTIAPGDSARVEVTLDVPAGRYGVHTGAVTVERAGGREPLVLPVNLYAEPPRRDVDVTVLDRRGEPFAGGSLLIGNMDTLWQPTGGSFAVLPLDENGRAHARMAPGPYSMMVTVETPARDGEPASYAIVGDPEVRVDEDVSVVIDARRAEPLAPAEVAGVRTRVTEAYLSFERRDEAGLGTVGAQLYAPSEDVTRGRVFLQPTARVTRGEAAAETRWRLATVGRPGAGQADLYDLALGGPTIPDPPVYGVSRAEARRLVRVDADYRALGGTASAEATEFRLARLGLGATDAAVAHPLPLPGRRVEMVNARPGLSWTQCVNGPDPDIAQFCATPTAAAPGGREAPVWFRTATVSATQLVHEEGQLAVGVGLSDGQHMGHLRDRQAAGYQPTRLFLDGEELTPLYDDVFPTPPGRGDYRLESSARPDQERLPIGRRIDTAWSFASEPGEAPDLLTVDYRPSDRYRAWLPPTVGLRIAATDRIGGELPTVSTRSVPRVWFSRDGGERWVRAVVLPGADGTSTAVAPLIPLPGDRLSIRVSAEAGDGRAIEQTILDAYPVTR